ncbi:MAG: phenylalanine--tRNA ligase subunit beta [Candidatus Cloacimonadota bacterium]|nr:MAG: phenylalanine--tRNA ligase subunit beta [Candidatus Cloacimonadota bacterium]
MNISFKWLKDYLDLPVNENELADKMTFAGIEVEKIKNINEELKQIKVSEVRECEKHPNADKLSLCKVFDGNEEHQVVCGAPNCRSGLKVAFAPVGTVFDDFKIKKAKIRGVQSCGMLCSEAELGLSEANDGIFELPEDAPVGENLADFLEKTDTVYEVEITPNRPDLLGMIGVARDLSALFETDIKTPDLTLPEGTGHIYNDLMVENQKSDKCFRYTARMIKNVKVAESPDWLKEKLLAAGLRPVNNIVDITNFVMMEYGHPLHAFDYAEIAKRKIVIRDARENEKFVALGGEEYELNPSDLVIADGQKILALAGIIGGADSGIKDSAVNIVLEAADFDQFSVRRTGNRLKITTDSCYRFERGMSSENADRASRRAVKLILEIAGGELVGGEIDSYRLKKEAKKVSVRMSRIEKILGIKAKKSLIIDYLTRLGLKLESEENGTLCFIIPDYRQDLVREIDLIEEIIRLYGYDNVAIPEPLPEITDKKSFYARRDVADILVENGFFEIINLSFGDYEALDKLKLAEDDRRRKTVKIKNPLGKNSSVMRSTLIPHLLENARYNINHGEKNFKTFELNKVFFDDESKLGKEEWNICGLLTGSVAEPYWKDKDSEIDFYDVKGTVEEILEKYFVMKNLRLSESFEPYFQTGAAAVYEKNNQKIVELGKVDPKICEVFGIEKEIWLFDFNFSALLRMTDCPTAEFKPLPKVPFVQRDLSFVISKQHNFSEIEKAVGEVNPKIIKNVSLFDIYEGNNIEKGAHSLAINIILGSETKNLTDEYINNLLAKIQKKLIDRFSIKMR